MSAGGGGVGGGLMSHSLLMVLNHPLSLAVFLQLSHQ